MARFHDRQYGIADGENVDDDDLCPPRFCASDAVTRRYHWEDDDDDREQKRSRSRGFLNQVSSWFDGRSRSRRQHGDGDRGSGWYRGEASSGCHRK
jgi:hypothetical protein